MLRDGDRQLGAVSVLFRTRAMKAEIPYSELRWEIPVEKWYPLGGRI